MVGYSIVAWSEGDQTSDGGKMSPTDRLCPRGLAVPFSDFYMFYTNVQIELLPLLDCWATRIDTTRVLWVTMQSSAMQCSSHRCTSLLISKNVVVDSRYKLYNNFLHAKRRRFMEYLGAGRSWLGWKMGDQIHSRLAL